MKTPSKSCYFFEDTSSPPDERGMLAICEECCKKEDSSFNGWFWDSKKGYGDYNLECHKCKTVIHKGINE
jgi:hypothetical protein